MPDVFFPVTEISTNILDPLIAQISETVLRQLGIRQYFDTSIYYNTPRTTSSLADDGRGNINLSRNRCDITVEEILNPAGVMWDTATTGNQTAYGTSPSYRSNYQSIFRDDIAGVSILEHTMPAALFFSFKLKFLSFDAAQIAFASILGQNHGTVVGMVHDVVYSYPIALRLLVALSAIHQRRVSFTGDFNAYLDQYATVQWHRNIRKLDVGSTPQEFQLVAQKQQLRCQALLECTQNEPELDRVDKLAQSYSIDFSYKVQFGRPNILQLVLPVSVENQSLPDALFSKEKYNAVDFLQNRIQTMSFTKFMDSYSNYRPPPLIMRLPSYDDFSPPPDGMLTTAGYHSFVSAAMTLDIPGPTHIDFSNLGDYRLADIVVELIKLHSQSDLLGHQGLFNLSIFADDTPLDASLLTIDMLTTTIAIAATVKTKVYRILVSEATDLKWVHPKWYPTLLKYRFFFPMTIERNLNILLNAGGAQITSDPELTLLIARLMQKRQLDSIIENLITRRAADYHIYSYTKSAQQFGDYIGLTRAKYPPEKAIQTLRTSVVQPSLGPVLTFDNTTDIFEDMLVYGDAIPAGTVVLSVTSSTVTLSTPTTTAVLADSTLTFVLKNETIYDAFIRECLKAGYVTPDLIPNRSLRTPTGYPYGPNQGGFYAFNLPLRIFNVAIRPANPGQSFGPT